MNLPKVRGSELPMCLPDQWHLPQAGRITSLQTFAGQLGTSALFVVVSPGNAASGVNYGLPYSLLATNIASTILPSATTGTIFFGQGLSSSPLFIPVSGDVVVTNSSSIATTTITSHAVTFAKMQQVTGPSIIGNVATALADLGLPGGIWGEKAGTYTNS